ALAAFSKQTALALALPFGVALAFEDRPALLGFAAAIAIVAGGGGWLLDRASAGWFSFYTVRLPGAHRIDRGAVPGFWPRDLLAPFAIALAFAIAALVTRPEHVREIPAPRPARRAASGAPVPAARGRPAADPLDVALLAAGVLAAWLARLHEGGA